MKLKKLVTAALCAAMTLSLAACGGGNSSNSSSDSSSADNVLAKVQEAGVLKVSVSPDFAPYEFQDPSKSGQDVYVGADVEMIRYIAKELGVECEIVAMDFDTCLAAVTQDKVDCSINGY